MATGRVELLSVILKTNVEKRCGPCWQDTETQFPYTLITEFPLLEISIGPLFLEEGDAIRLAIEIYYNSFILNR